MTTVVFEQKTASIPAILFKKPYYALIAFVTLMCWQAVAHMVVAFQRLAVEAGIMTSLGEAMMNVAVGFIGLAFVWKGFKKDELTASCFGALGGAFIWFGWFEHTFVILGDHIMGIPVIPMLDPATGEVMISEQTGQLIPYFTPGLQLIQASAVFILPVLIMLGLNKDTRCRFFLWFHRRGAKPETPSVGYRRQYSRITALQYVMITWFIYAYNITILDQRLFAVGGIGMSVLFLAYVIWSIYLFYKVMRQGGPAPGIVRYAMAVGICIWLIPEWLAATQMIKETWLHPQDYPISSLLIFLAMVFGGYVVYSAPDRGAKPKVRKSQVA